MKSKPNRLSVIILGGLLVIALIYSAYSTNRNIREDKYIGQLHRSAHAMAITLHREHFKQDPSSLHILWWSLPESPTEGLVTHTPYLDPVYGGDETVWAQDSAGLWVFVKKYNYVTVGQACYLALQGEDSPRIRNILEIASQSYAPSSEANLLVMLPKLKQGDEDAKALFKQVYRWSSESFRPNRRYFEEELIPSFDAWSQK